MTEAQKYMTEIINLVPENSVCFIQAPDNENIEFANLMSASPFPYYKQVILTSENKKLLKKIILDEALLDDLQSIEIKFMEKLLFEGYDGMEFGIISKDIQMTDTFLKNIDQGLYAISEQW